MLLMAASSSANAQFGDLLKGLKTAVEQAQQAQQKRNQPVAPQAPANREEPAQPAAGILCLAPRAIVGL